MGRRRRKMIARTRQPLIPDVFQCPACGTKAIKIQIDRKVNTASVKCGTCKISEDIDVNPLMEPVDVFGKFVDRYFVKVKEERST